MKIRAYLISAILLASAPMSHGGEVKIGTPEQKDIFIESLLASKDLKAAGISIVQTSFKREDDVFSATIAETLDVGFFPLSAIDRQNVPGLRKFYTAFTRPFFFRDGEEVFATQDTALGDAALADLRHTGIFPLKFWNRGFSKIVARNPISSARDFRRLKVAATRESTVTAPTLVSLGAEPTPLQDGDSVSDAFARGVVKATIVDPGAQGDGSDWNDLSEVHGQLFSTNFEPIIGVVAASEKYWTGLSEKERQAWKRAIEEASRASRDEIKSSELIANRYTKIRPIVLMDKDRRNLIANMSGNAEASKIKQDLLTVQEAKSKAMVAETIKKKN